MKESGDESSIVPGHSPRGLRNEAASEARMRIRAFVVFVGPVDQFEATVLMAAGLNSCHALFQEFKVAAPVAATSATVCVTATTEAGRIELDVFDTRH